MRCQGAMHANLLYNEMRKQIYLFGDSLTEFSIHNGGWGASLANLFSRKADLVIRGYGGYNSRWAMKALEKGKVFPPTGSIDDATFEALTIFFGANDASLPGSWCEFTHVPLEEYKQNLHSIVSFVKERWPRVKVVMITPPPIDEAARLLDPWGNGESLERTNENTGKYAKACLEVAAQCEVPAVDLWSRMQQLPEWEKTLLSDGLHLTPEGNMVVFEEVVKKLKEVGISPETLPFDLPFYTELLPPNDAVKVFEILS